MFKNLQSTVVMYVFHLTLQTQLLYVFPVGRKLNIIDFFMWPRPIYVCDRVLFNVLWCMIWTFMYSLAYLQAWRAGHCDMWSWFLLWASGPSVSHGNYRFTTCAQYTKRLLKHSLPLTFESPAVSFRTTRFNILKFYTVRVLRSVFCTDLRTDSNLCFIHH
jgi:hypothetical protein